MIRTEQLRYSYDGPAAPVLDDVNLLIRQGEYVAIIGPNGCGKTTFTKLLNGLLSPTGGEVWVDELNTKNPRALRPIRQKVGMVFQIPDNQIVGMTVEEDVAFGPGNLCLPPGEIRLRVDRALDRVGLRGYGLRAPHLLSSGEKQLVSIAGVLAMHPAYLVLDEPTASLDPAGRTTVLEVMARLNAEGITIVHVTHDMDEAARAGRVVVMHQGAVAADEPPGDLFARVEFLERLGLGVPAAARLLWELKQAGVDVPLGVLTLDDALAVLAPLVGAQPARRTGPRT